MVSSSGFNSISKGRKKRMDKKSEGITSASVWYDNNGHFSVVPKITEKIPAGLYSCTVTMQGEKKFITKKIKTDQLIVLDDSPSHKVLKEIEQFWDNRDLFVSNGFLHKRGFLLGGPPGSGKTITTNLVIKSIIEDHDGVALYITNPYEAAECLQDFRKAEPERPLVAVMEDLDDLIDKYTDTAFLALLDGEHQIDNIVYIATTNNAYKLKDRIVKRPSRFDTCMHVPMPSSKVREIYISNKMSNLSKQDLERWVELTDGLSIAHIKECIILHLCFNYDVKEAIDRLKDLDLKAEETKYNDESKSPMGFFLKHED